MNFIKDKIFFIIGITVALIIIFTLIFINIQAQETTPNKGDEVSVQINPAPKTKYYEVTKAERLLIAKIVTCEADEYSLECQKAVASVIFNRLESGKWQKDMNEDGKITVYDIIYYPNAFTPVQDGALDRCTTPSESAYKAVDYVIQNGPTVPTQVRYFRDYYDFDWKNYANYTVIDDMHFGYFTNWEQGEW